MVDAIDAGSVTRAERQEAAKKALKFRKERSLNQSQLAEQVGTNQPTISHAERAFPTVPIKIVRALLALPVPV